MIKFESIPTDIEELDKFYVILGDQGTLGRAKSNDIILTSNFVSPVHLKFNLENNCLWITSTSSDAFYFVNNIKLLGKKKLNIGDIFRIEKIAFKVIEFQSIPITPYQEILEKRIEEFEEKNPQRNKLLFELQECLEQIEGKK